LRGQVAGHWTMVRLKQCLPMLRRYLIPMWQCQATPSPGNGGARMVEQAFHIPDAASHPTCRATCPPSSCMRGLFMIVNVLKFAPMGNCPYNCTLSLNAYYRY